MGVLDAGAVAAVVAEGDAAVVVGVVLALVDAVLTREGWTLLGLVLLGLVLLGRGLALRGLQGRAQSK